MKSKLWILFVWFLCLSSQAAQIKLITNDDEQLEIEVGLEPTELVPQKVKAAQGEFLRIPIQNEGLLTGREGLPETPELHRWLVVNPKAKYRVELIPGAYKIYQNVVLYPVQPDVLEEEEPVFTMNTFAYKRNKWFGKFAVRLGAPAMLGETTLLPITFSPVAYNPKKKELVVFEKLTVRLVNTGPKTLEEPVFVSRFVANHISNLTLNGDSFLRRNNIAGKKRALILYAKEFEEPAQELASLHQAEGTEVQILEVPAGTKSKTVKTLIEGKYLEQKMDAVTLLGDEVAIPFAENSMKAGDFSYSLVSGTDQLSDIAVGRLPVKNLIQAKIMINKMKKYRELLAQGFTNKRVMLVAHSQGYPGKYTGNLESVRKSDNPLGLEFTTQYGGEEATNKTLIEELQKGYSIINYRGHGSSSSWSSWGSDGASFSIKQVEALPFEPTSLSFVFNVACSNGAIQNSSATIVEKQLFPSEKIDSFQGAVGTFGATAPSMTEVNHRFNLNLFKYLQTSEEKAMGDIYALANNKLTQDNDGSATSNTRMYVLYADPLLSLWIH